MAQRRPSVRREIVIRGDRRILLHDVGLEEISGGSKLTCVDRAGATIWRAQLPASAIPDSFADVERYGDALIATTHRGHRLAICLGTGRMLDRLVEVERWAGHASWSINSR